MGISTYIAQFLAQRDLLDVVRQYGLEPFEVNVVSLERTFTEKVLALVRACYAADPIAELRSKIRHVYDLHALLKVSALATFLQQDEFFQMLQAVQADDARNSEFQGAWAAEPLASCLLFGNVATTWRALASAYQQDFRSLVYGTLPDSAEIQVMLETIAQRLTLYKPDF